MCWAFKHLHSDRDEWVAQSSSWSLTFTKVNKCPLQGSYITITSIDLRHQLGRPPHPLLSVWVVLASPVTNTVYPHPSVSVSNCIQDTTVYRILGGAHVHWGKQSVGEGRSACTCRLWWWHHFLPLLQPLYSVAYFFSDLFLFLATSAYKYVPLPCTLCFSFFFLSFVYFYSVCFYHFTFKRIFLDGLNECTFFVLVTHYSLLWFRVNEHFLNIYFANSHTTFHPNIPSSVVQRDGWMNKQKNTWVVARSKRRTVFLLRI